VCVFDSLIKNPADRADLKMLMVRTFAYMVAVKLIFIICKVQ